MPLVRGPSDGDWSGRPGYPAAMGFFDELAGAVNGLLNPTQIDDGVRGTAQVISTSGYYGRALYQNCHLELVVEAPGIPATAVSMNAVVHRQHWPHAGAVLPALIEKDEPAGGPDPLGRDRRLPHRWRAPRPSGSRLNVAASARPPLQAAGPGFVGNPLGIGAGATVKVVGDVSKITPEQKEKLRAMGVDLDALLGEQPPDVEGPGRRNASRRKAARSGENWSPGLLRPGQDSLRVDQSSVSALRHPRARHQLVRRGDQPLGARRQLGGALGTRRILVVGDAQRARRRHATEGRGPLERDREVAIEEAPQDAVGELGDLLRSRGQRRSGHDGIDGGQHLGAALEQQRNAIRILADQHPHQVDAPERAGQAVR